MQLTVVKTYRTQILYLTILHTHARAELKARTSPQLGAPNRPWFKSCPIGWLQPAWLGAPNRPWCKSCPIGWLQPQQLGHSKIVRVKLRVEEHRGRAARSLALLASALPAQAVPYLPEGSLWLRWKRTSALGKGRVPCCRTAAASRWPLRAATNTASARSGPRAICGCLGSTRL